MKKLLFITVFLFCPIFYLFAGIQPKKYADTCIVEIEVIKIQKKYGAYIIHLYDKSDDLHYVVVSIKSRVRDGKKIKVGEKYSIHLNPYYEEDIIPDHALVFDLVLKGKKIFVPSEGIHGNVYTSPDLVGLRIIERQAP